MSEERCVDAPRAEDIREGLLGVEAAQDAAANALFGLW